VEPKGSVRAPQDPVPNEIFNSKKLLNNMDFLKEYAF
jgi:hypothetical protein